MSTVTAVPLRPTRRRVLVFLWIGIVVAIVAAVWLAFSGTAAQRAMKGTDGQFLAWNKGRPGVHETASGLQYQVLKKGEGNAHPTSQDVALLSYVGRLRDGTVFDASQQPVPFPLSGGAIPGFLEGVKMMEKGAVYRFWMKPELAYGDQTPDPAKIPPNSMLVFDVTLVDFVPETLYRQLMMQQMMQQGRGAGGPGGAAGTPPPSQP